MGIQHESDETVKTSYISIHASPFLLSALYDMHLEGDIRRRYQERKGNFESVT